MYTGLGASCPTIYSHEVQSHYCFVAMAISGGTGLTWLFALIIAIGVAPSTKAWTRDYYTAAVFEHAREGDSTNMSPEIIVETNLGFYRKAASIAKSKGADLILFPEYGIFPSSSDRKFTKSFLENIPDPKKIRANPCEEADVYSTRPILYSLSCMAKQNGIVVVANTGDIQPCNGHPKCPEDGTFHFNANVAFDKDGTLLARYYKEHLYYELNYDLPIEDQDPTFKTEFGTFATFICFEIIFKKMSEYSQNPGIEAILFSAMWINSSPLFTSIPFWQSWAMGNNATVLVSNIQMPGHFATGSGIFKGRGGSLAYTFNPDGISKLVVAKIPRSNGRFKKMSKSSYSITAIAKNGSMEFKDEGKNMPPKCSWRLLGDSKNLFKDYRCYDGNTTIYELTKLTKPEGRLEACSNGMCCSLDYSASGMEGEFYLGVFNGTHVPYLRYGWAEEICFLARCDELEGIPCTTFPMTTKTLFHRVRMTANFTTNIIYPTVARSKMRPVPLKDWTFGVTQKHGYEAVIDFKNVAGRRLLVVGLKGRNYERDPVYER